jgi:hypothetical protein
MSFALNKGEDLLIMRQPSSLSVKRLIWIYFWLLIFEGSVRKWIPVLSSPFLLIRDPIALLIWFNAVRMNLISRNQLNIIAVYALFMTLFGLVQVIVAMLPIPIFFYGWRTYVLHFPVIVIAIGVLNSDDLKRIGRWLLLLSLPMAILMFAQYIAPGDSWLNRGAFEGGGQIDAAMGHIRPAGTFSFITGAASFAQLTVAFVLLGLTKNIYPKWLVICAGIAIAACLPISGSRTLVLGVGAVVATALVGVLIRGTVFFKIDQIPKILVGIIAASLLLLGLSQIPTVQEGMMSFSERWNHTAEGEGGGSGTAAVESRLSGPFTSFLDTASTVPIFGRGIGLGSNFGGVYTGAGGLALGETQWDREINELGPIIGLPFIVLRVLLTLMLMVASFRALRRDIILPLYLLPTAAMAVLSSSLDQPTSQGFLVILTTLNCVALKDDLPSNRQTEVAL